MSIYGYLFWFLFSLSFLTYAVQHIICAYFYKTQNLKKRYKASWALVTGASSGVFERMQLFLAVSCGKPPMSLGSVGKSGTQMHQTTTCPAQVPIKSPDLRAAGIGKSISVKLARQGLNVVLVALGDKLLDETFEELQQQFPQQHFRKVCCVCLDAQGVCAEQTCVFCCLGAFYSVSHTVLQTLHTQVPANLGGDDYLPKIADATKDIPVQVSWGGACRHHNPSVVQMCIPLSKSLGVVQ